MVWGEQLLLLLLKTVPVTLNDTFISCCGSCVVGCPKNQIVRVIAPQHSRPFAPAGRLTV